MSTLTKHNRRWTDRAPIMSRIGWAFWRAWYDLKREAPAIVGFCAVSVFWALLAYCAVHP